MQSTPHQHFVLCRPGAGCVGPGGSPVTKPPAEFAKQGSPETPIPALATGGSAERPVDVCLRCISAKQTCNIILDQQTLEKGSRDLQKTP